MKKLFFLIFTLFFTQVNSRENREVSNIGVFTYGVSEPLLSLSPFAGTGFTMWQAHQLLFDFLLFEDPGQRDVFRPALAKKWTISKDKKVFEFELREAQWTDGKPVTAEDVKFSIDHISDPRYKSIWVGSFLGIEKVEVLNPQKVRITIKEPQFDLWKALVVSLKIIPKHFYLEPDKTSYGREALGSGPYKLSEFDTGRKFFLEKNPNWWGWKDSELKNWYKPEKIKFMTVNSVVIPALFQKNELDLLRVTDLHALDALKKKDLKLQFIFNPNKDKRMVEQILFNLKHPLFAQDTIRKALNLLVERKTLCEKTYSGGKPFGETSPEKARELLKKLGWADSNKDGILDKEGKDFQFTVIYDSQDYESILTKLKEYLKANGIVMNLQSVDYSLIQKTLRDQKFDARIDRYDENHTLLQSVWDTKGAYNYTGFSDKKVDLMIRELDQLYDPKKRTKKINSMRKIIHQIQPSLMLCEVKSEDFVAHQNLVPADLKKGIQFWGWFTSK